MTKRRSDESMRLVYLLPGCDNTAVQIFGPYPPGPQRKTWRIQLYCSTTKAKKSVMANSKEEAELLIRQLREEIARAAGLTCHKAIELFIQHKATYVQSTSAQTVGDRLRTFLPDMPLSHITESKAQQLYLAETKRIGRFGPVKPASHQAFLRTTKEFFRWLVKTKQIQKSPFADIEPIGRANAGKTQPTETDAQKLDTVLFEAAKAGEEGALALLVQLYLGLRSSEVLKLLVSSVERQGRKVSIVRGKTRNARRSLDLYPEVANLLWQLCMNRPASDRVFAAHLPRTPASNYLWKRLHHYCRRAGIPEYCPHSLRGLHSSLALVGGATSHQVAAQLGHASFATTAKHYADPSAVENSQSRRFATAMKADGEDPLADMLKSLTAQDKARLLSLLAAG